MPESIGNDCEHQWDSDFPVRVCLLCGQIRAFPNGDSNPRIVWPGRDTKSDPLQLPKFDKAYIAGVAKRYGIKKLSELAGISCKILRAWGATYCRESFLQQLSPVQTPTEKKRGRPPKPGPVVPRRTSTIAKPRVITLTKVAPGNCQICGAELYLMLTLITNLTIFKPPKASFGSAVSVLRG